MPDCRRYGPEKFLFAFHSSVFVIECDARRTSYRHSLQIYENKIKVKLNSNSNMSNHQCAISEIKSTSYEFQRSCQSLVREQTTSYFSRYSHSARSIVTRIHFDGPVAGHENPSTANSFILDFISLTKLHPMHSAHDSHPFVIDRRKCLNIRCHQIAFIFKILFLQANVYAFPKFICWIKQWRLDNDIAEIDFVVRSRNDSTICKLHFNWFHSKTSADGAYPKRSSTYVDFL